MTHNPKIAAREQFRHGNMYGEWVGGRYVVYSYGPNWPLAIWDEAAGWRTNATPGPSPTTRRHANEVSRSIPAHTPCEKNELVAFLAHQGATHNITDKQPSLFDVST